MDDVLTVYAGALWYHWEQYKWSPVSAKYRRLDSTLCDKKHNGSMVPYTASEIGYLFKQVILTEPSL